MNRNLTLPKLPALALPLGGKGVRRTVGLEFSGDRVRAVMIEHAGDETRLLACGTVGFSASQIREGEVLEVDRVAEDVGGLFRELRMSPRGVATSISGRAVIVKRIQMETMADDLVRDTLQFEAGDHIPFDISDVCLDYQVVRRDLPGNLMEVLLVAARKEVIANRRDLLKAAGLTLSAIDVDAFAVQRAYEVNYRPPPEDTVVLIHVGDQVTSLNVVRAGLPLFVRDLALATHTFVSALEQRHGLAADEARRTVFDPDSSRQPSLGETLESASESIAMEIDRSFAYMRAQEEVGTLDRAVLSGEGARIPGLAQKLSDAIGLPVEVSDPLRKLKVDPSVFAGADAQEAAPALAVAVGLALRGREAA